MLRTVSPSIPLRRRYPARGSRGNPSRRVAPNCSVALLRRTVCDGTVTGSITVRSARRRLLAGDPERGAKTADSEAVDIVDDCYGERVPCQDRLDDRTAQAGDGGETGVAWRRRIHDCRPALRQAQGTQLVEGAGTPPGREFTDAVPGD